MVSDTSKSPAPPGAPCWLPVCSYRRHEYRYHVRSEGQIVKEAVYIVIGVNLDGRKNVLSMWIAENENTKFWKTVLNGLKTGE